MVGSVKKFFVMASVLMLAIAVLNSASFSQEKKKTKEVDIKKIYAAIAGEYEVDFGGQVLEATFFVDEKSGKMWGGTTGSEEELTAVGETGLEFAFDSVDGTVVFTMEKDGKVEKFTVNVQGQEGTGIKVKKKKAGGK